MATSAVHNFNAQWDHNTAHLQPPSRPRQLAWNLFSIVCFPILLVRHAGFAVGSLANRVVLPAAHYSEAQVAEVKREFDAAWARPGAPTMYTQESVSVTTPTGVPLSALVFRHRKAEPGARTVICFNGNGQLARDHVLPWPAVVAAQTGAVCNVMTWDYPRKYGTTADLVLAGASVAQYVERDLRVPPKEIRFCGTSLGGAVAIHTKALNPEFAGPLLVDRSFRSLTLMVQSIVTRIFGEGIFSRSVGRAVDASLRSQGYRFDSEAELKKCRGPVLVTHHNEDRVIPPDASLGPVVSREQALHLTHGTQQGDAHNTPLGYYIGERDRATQFLLQ
jgi:pimeloyl-ACP methyl ester carboxylesterase